MKTLISNLNEKNAEYEQALCETENPFSTEAERQFNDELEEYNRRCRSEFMRNNLTDGERLEICHI